MTGKQDSETRSRVIVSERYPWGRKCPQCNFDGFHNMTRFKNEEIPVCGSCFTEHIHTLVGPNEDLCIEDKERVMFVEADVIHRCTKDDVTYIAVTPTHDDEKSVRDCIFLTHETVPVDADIVYSPKSSMITFEERQEKFGERVSPDEAPDELVNKVATIKI